MITLIKRWLEKRREKRLYPYKDCQPIINYDPIIIGGLMDTTSLFNPEYEATKELFKLLK
jgi:hypothetical protein